MDSPVAPHSSTPAELKERLEAERTGLPFLVYRDADRHQRICALGPGDGLVTIGRKSDNPVALEWDPEVSRLHATLECVGGNWTISDDGLSRNGSFVNGERLTGRHRLEDGDTIVVGSTAIVFREPGVDAGESTAQAGAAPQRANLSARQREVLLALCRPHLSGDPYATPATNQQIADEVIISLDAVKSNLRGLFQKFGIDDLPQNQKRARLVALALQGGLVTERDLG